MINKNRPIIQGSKMAKDHDGAAILVTLTLVPFSTRPYRVDVQWSDNMPSRVSVTRTTGDTGVAEYYFDEAIGFECKALEGCTHSWAGTGVGAKQLYIFSDSFEAATPTSKEFKSNVQLAKAQPEPRGEFTVITTELPEEELKWYPAKLEKAAKARLEEFGPLSKTGPNSMGYASHFEKMLHTITGNLSGWRYGDGNLDLAFQTFYQMSIDKDDQEAFKWAHYEMSNVDAEYW